MDEQDGALAAIEQAMLVIRRRQGRGNLRQAVPRDHVDPAALTWIPALEAIEELAPAAPVRTVPPPIALEAPRASRIAAAAASAGYVERVASQTDGRAVHLILSPAGQRFVDYAHAYRRGAIDPAMRDLEPGERARFVE